MPARKFDLAATEQRFITGDESIRTIAKDIGISFGALAEQARRHEWRVKRESYRLSVGRKVTERVADKWADQKADIVDEALVVLRKTIREFYARLENKDSPVAITVKDVTMAINQMLLLLGEPTQRTESRNLDLNFSAEIDPELLKRLEELTRGDAPRGDGGTSRSYLEITGPH